MSTPTQPTATDYRPTGRACPARTPTGVGLVAADHLAEELSFAASVTAGGALPPARAAAAAVGPQRPLARFCRTAGRSWKTAGRRPLARDLRPRPSPGAALTSRGRPLVACLDDYLPADQGYSTITLLEVGGWLWLGPPAGAGCWSILSAT